MLAPDTVVESTLSWLFVCLKLFVSHRGVDSKLEEAFEAMKAESKKELKKDFIAKGNRRKALKTHKGSKKIWKITGKKYIKHKMQTSKKLSTASAPSSS